MDWDQYRKALELDDTSYQGSPTDPTFLRRAALEMDAAAHDVMRRAQRRKWPRNDAVDFPPMAPRSGFRLGRAPKREQRPGYANRAWTLCMDGSWAFERWAWCRPHPGSRNPYEYMKWTGSISRDRGGDIVVDMHNGSIDLHGAIGSLMQLADYHGIMLW